MNDDLLTDSVRALRESTDGASDEAARTRAQILALSALRIRHRRRIAIVVVPLAAAFFVTTAWGAVSGRLPQWFEMTFHDPQPTGVEAAPPAPRGMIPPRASVELPSTASTVIVTTEPTTTPEVAPTSPAASSSPAATFSPAPSARALKGMPPVSKAEDALYAKAHQAHFVNHDPAAALRGWDAYVAAYPTGRFTLEARYNRAIALVRLGRRDEARQALTPFAQGTYAGYRQSEASELLDALAAADGKTKAP